MLNEVGSSCLSDVCSVSKHAMLGTWEIVSLNDDGFDGVNFVPFYFFVTSVVVSSVS